MLIVVLSFIGVFLLVFLTLFLLSARPANDLKETLSRLKGFTNTGPAEQTSEVVDILREDVLSDIPWLNDLLHSFNVFPAMRQTLAQANVEWKLSAIMLSSALIALAVGLLVYMRTSSLPITLVLGGVT